MAAIFPGWKPSRESDSNIATPARESPDLPATRDTPTHLHVTQVPHIEGAYTEDPDDLDFDPEPWGVVKLDELHAALITFARAGQTPAGGAYDVVGAYFFSREDSMWRLSKRLDVVAWGISNETEQVKAEQWPSHGYVLSLITENGNQGAFASKVDMTLLSADSAVHLLYASLGETDEASGNYQDAMGAMKDGISCGDLEKDDFKLPPSDRLEFGDEECRSAEGHWSLDGDLIRFAYHGVVRNVDHDGKLLPLRQWNSTAVYRFNKGTAELVAGKDPHFGY
jgi:hypothetical protein